MSRGLYPGDPAYDEAMREAKKALADSIERNSMKGKGRPKAVAAAAPIVEDDDVDLSDIGVTAEHAIPEPPAPPAPAAPAKRASVAKKKR